MTIRSGIFNSVNGDRRYKAEDFAEYFASFIGNGVFPNPSNGFQVMANNDMTITLKAGKAWINGYYVINDENYNMALDFADGVLNRIDRIVLQFNYANRSIVPLVKKGVFASVPVKPVLKRDNDAYELALADIYIGKGAISITQANITDLRLNNDLCGIVHSTVDQVDTTTLFNQYQDFFNKYSTEKTAEFEAWVEMLKDILSGDVAGNLLNLITINTKILIRQKRNVRLSLSNWTYDNDLYKYQVNNVDITEDSFIDVNVHLSDLIRASSIVACESFDGYMIIYSTSPIAYDITIDYRITREVNL